MLKIPLVSMGVSGFSECDRNMATGEGRAKGKEGENKKLEGNFHYQILNFILF